MFGEQCCTSIPNNTAPDGKLTRAIKSLRSLNQKMKEHSGVDTSMWDGWLNKFGRFKGLITSVLLSIAVFTGMLILSGCAFRALIVKLINTAITKVDGQPHEVMNLVSNSYDMKWLLSTLAPSRMDCLTCFLKVTAMSTVHCVWKSSNTTMRILQCNVLSGHTSECKRICAYKNDLVTENRKKKLQCEERIEAYM